MRASTGSKWAALGLVGAFGLTACDAGAGDEVSLRLKWLHQSQFAGFYAAEEQGFYEDAELEVEMEPGGPDSPSIQLVASGSEEFGVAGADQILLAQEQGVDIVALASVYQQTPFVMITREEDGYEDMSDLGDATVGVKFGQSEEATYRAMLAAAGMDDPAEEPVQVDLGPFLNGGVDAFPGYSINEAIAAEREMPVNIIAPEDLDLHLYGDVLFTRADLVEDDPELVRDFTQASIAGWEWAVDNPDDASALAQNYDSNADLDHEAQMMHASLPSIQVGDAPVGHMDAEGWESLQDLLLDQGLMDEAVDIDSVFTTEFLD